MVGGLIGLFLLSVVLIAALGTQPVGPNAGNTRSGGQGQDVDGIKCQGTEQLAYHIHQHLFILVDGNPQTVPAYIGIPGGPILPKCIYWLHTHDDSGIIHVESPVEALYTLGQFFDIWGQPLNSSEVANHHVTGGALKVFVDAKTYSGDPRDIPLKAHTRIVLEIGKQVPPPTYEFPAGV